MATYYISTTGNDTTGAGTIGSPWWSLNKVWTVVSAGDIVYMRGGTFAYTVSQDLTGVDGTSGSHITVSNYSNESPIISGASNTEAQIIYMNGADYIDFIGIRVTDLEQPDDPPYSGYYGWHIFSDVNNCTWTLCEADHIGGWGFSMGSDSNVITNLTFTNCDSHHNQDPYSDHWGGDNYGGSDGFQCGSENADNITLIGCRSWSNSDDGYDFFQMPGLVTFINCWAWYNGFIPDTFDTGGNGEGFKFGSSTYPPDTNDIKRIAHNCVAYRNRTYGFEAYNENYYFSSVIYNCISYYNALGYSIENGFGSNTIIRNSIAYANTNNDVDWMDGGVPMDHNSWDIPVTITDADFASVTPTGIDGARQGDGSLPLLTFLHLASDSDCIGAGVDVGLIIDGDGNAWNDPPDIGPFRYLDATTTTSTTTAAPTTSTTAAPTTTTTTSTTTEAPTTSTTTSSTTGTTTTGTTTETPTTTEAPDIDDMITGNVPTYRFYVSSSPATQTKEVFPLNFNPTSLVDQQENKKVFYRRKFNGSLLFGTNSIAINAAGTPVNRYTDWTYFWNIEQTTPCLQLYFVIKKTISGVTSIYWEGMFSTTDGEIDIDRCTFEVTPMANDDYTDILANVDIQYNILPAEDEKVTTTAIIGSSINETYTRNRWLTKIGSDSVLDYLAEQIKTGVTVSSDFFTDATNPVTKAANHLLHLTIAQKSDIIRYQSTNQASIALLSWNEFMDILWAMFEVTWDYDFTTDTINVEHISWWTAGAGIDLRTQMATQSTNKYTYLKEAMPKYEKFSFMEAEEINFIGTPIWYDSPCVDQNPETNIRQTTIPVTTDLEYIIRYRFLDTDNESIISDEGFVILCNYFDDPDYFVEIQPGSMDGTSHLNMHLSWANLHHHYFRHNRVLISGYLNNDPTTFVSAQKTKQQKCSAILCDTDAYDPDDTITTELGETYFDSAKAKVKTSSLSPMGNIDFTLLYGPASNAWVAIPDLKYIIVSEEVTVPVTTSVWTAVSSEPTTSDTHVHLYMTCVDPNGDTDDTANVQITILSGNTSGFNTITWVDPGAGAICVGALHPDSSDAVGKGWLVTYIQSEDSKCIT